METDYRNLIILNSIDELRNVKKLRPDKDKIVSYAAKEYGLDEAQATEALENLVNKKLVFLKSTAAGQESYFINKDTGINNMGNEKPSKSQRDRGMHEWFSGSSSHNVNPMNVVDTENTVVNQKQHTPSLENTSVFCILGQFSGIINNLSQQLQEERTLNRSLAVENLNLKIRLEKLLFENGKEEEQLVRKPNNLETNEILKKYGSNRTSECETQARATTMQTPPLDNISLVGGKDAQIYPMENNRRLAQQSFSVQLKEVQAFKHQEYLLHKSKECTMEDSSNVNEEDKKTASKKQQQKRTDNVNKYYGNSKGSRQPKRNSRKANNNNNNNSYNDQNYKSNKKSANKPKPEAKKRVLLLGDSHVRRVDESKSLPEYFIAKGIGGLRSEQLVSKHRGTINSELQKVDEIIVHIGSNDISKGMKKERVVDNIDKACRKFRDVNPNIEVSVSSIFLQKYDTPKNLEIVETNAAL